MPNLRRLLRVCPGLVDCVISRGRLVAAIAAFVAALGSVLAHAGTNTWTTNGPYGGLVTVLAVDPQTPANLYAAGFSGVFKSSDSGANWTRSSNGITDPSVDSLVIDPATPTTLYVGSIQGGQIAKSTDGAATWSALSNSPTLVTAMAIDPQATGTIYAAQQASGLQKTTDSGATWTAIGFATLPGFPTFSALIVDPATPATVYAGEHVNGIYKSTDGGATWAASNTGMNGPVFQTISMAIDPKTPSTLYAVVWTSGNPGLFKSTDSGGTWTNILANGTNFIETVAVDPKTPSTIYVGQFVGTGASALISTDGGSTFTPIQTGLPNSTAVEVLAINPLTPATLYAGTINGVYKTSNSGGAWTETINGLALTNVTAVAVDPATPTTIYAGTSASGLFKSTDSGGSWVSINTGVGSTGNEACIVPNYTALAIDPVTTSTLYASSSCTESSGVLKSIDGGAHWTVAATGLPEFGTIYGLAIDPLTTSTIYAAAGNSGLFQSTNGGGTWNADNGGLPPGDYISSVSTVLIPADETISTLRAPAGATRIPGASAASGVQTVAFASDQSGMYYSVNDGPWQPLTLEEELCEATVSHAFAEGAYGNVNSAKLGAILFVLCFSPLVEYNGTNFVTSNGQSIYVFPEIGTTAATAKSVGNGKSAKIQPRGGPSQKLVEAATPSPIVTNWAPPNGSNTEAVDCSPFTSLVGNPLDASGGAFYAGAACGVVSANSFGQNIFLMNSGLPVNLQINALGITPAGDALYAGATNGGVYQFVLGTQPPTQLAFTNINFGLSPTAGVVFDVVVQAAAADLSAQNVASDTTVQLSLASGIGTLGGTLSCQIPAGTSSCTVTGVTYSVADTNVVLTATSTAGDTLTAGNSPPFNVVAAETPTQLAIASVNGGVNPVAGAAFNVVVAAQAADLSEQNVAADTTVQLSVSTGAGTLGGTTSCLIPAGSSGCTVTGVTYSQVDTGVVLTATRTAGDSLTPGNSAPFNVTGVITAASIAPFAGTPQSATVNSAYATALQAVVKDGSNNAVAGASVTFTVPGSGASGTFSTSATVLTDSTGIATAPALTANGVVGAFAVQATTTGVASPASFALTNNARLSFSGVTATGNGTATAVLSGGGPTCTFATAAFVGAPVAPPPNVTFPQGLFDFTATGCVGTITVTVTFPATLPANTQYWKYGPTPGPVPAHWYTLGAPNNLSLTGSAATFTIADGSLGDDDLAVNGAIVDQGGPGVPNGGGGGGGGGGSATQPVPVLSNLALLLLLAFLGLLGAGYARRYVIQRK